MYGDLIPNGLQDELLAIRDTLSRSYWRIGDIVQEVIAFNQINRRPVERQTVYSAVGLFVGKASRSVREYYAIGRMFAPEIRELFSVLSFDHFRTAARMPDPIAALQWAVDQTEFLNRPATVDGMIANFLNWQPEQGDVPDPARLLPPGEPPDSTFYLGHALNSIDTGLKQLETVEPARLRGWTTEMLISLQVDLERMREIWINWGVL